MVKSQGVLFVAKYDKSSIVPRKEVIKMDRKYPILKINKVEIGDEEILRKNVFPKEFVYPIGTVNEAFETELEAYNNLSPEEKKEVNRPSLFDNKKFIEMLEQGVLCFNTFKPTPKDIVEGIGAKTLSVSTTYKGFGMYEILVFNGFQIRNDKKDRRYLIDDKNGPKYEEEFYIMYGTNEDGTESFKRIAKKSFYDIYNTHLMELLQNETFEEAKYQYKEKRDPVIKKEFFTAFFLEQATFFTTFKITSMDNIDSYFNYYRLNSYIKIHIEPMRTFYFYQNQKGDLSEFSYDKITDQIDKLEEAVNDFEELLLTIGLIGEEKQHAIDEAKPEEIEVFHKKLATLKEKINEIISNQYWVKRKTGEFYEDIVHYYKRFNTTSSFENDEVEELQRQYALTSFVYGQFVSQTLGHEDLSKIKKDEYIRLRLESALNDPSKITDAMNKQKKEITKLILNYQFRKKFPEIMDYLYIYDDFEREEIVNQVNEQIEKLKKIKGE